jgi:hypothetical protein
MLGIATEPFDGSSILQGVFGLGDVRSLEEYEQFSGVHFARKHVEPRAFWASHEKRLFMDYLLQLIGAT